MACKHFWKIVGGKHKWFSSPHGGDSTHALARCVHCPAWTVVEYGGMGPCSHVVVRGPWPDGANIPYFRGRVVDEESDEED